MKKHLLSCFCGCLCVLLFQKQVFAQIQSDTQLKSIDFSQLNISKSSSKLSANLNELYNSRHPDLQKKSAKAVVTSANGLEKFLQIKGDEVLVDITVKEDIEQAKAELASMGFKVKASFGRVISGSVAIGLLPKLETVKSIRFAKPAYKPLHRIKATNLLQDTYQFIPTTPQPVISQGDTAQKSNAARSRFGVKGNGVKVGILSDSYNALGTANIGVSAGELPGPGNPLGYNKPVQILEEYFGGGGTDEGRAMAEIVHDVAPGAELAFHSAANGEADFAQGIIDLQKAGCKVIVDDIYYYDEPFFQDGIVAQAVDEVKKEGVVYFSAAGNFESQSYESVYRGSTYYPFGTKFGTAHNFSAAGSPARYYLPIRIPIDSTFIASFQWDDPFYSAGGKGAKTDLDIYLLDSQGNIVNYFGNEDNIVTGDPIELIGYLNETNSTIFYVVITKFAGPDPTRLKYIDYGESHFSNTNPAVPGILASTLVGHAKAEGAIAVAAAPFFFTPAYGVNPPIAETFSSLGGVANYFDVNGNRITPKVRYKPEITSPDGGNTSFFYFDSRRDSDTYPNFFGTSAAAPHAAGVAALMIEARRGQPYNPDQVKSLLAYNAIDMDNPYTAGFDKGFDYKTGMGLINAEAAVAQVVNLTKALKTAEITKSERLIDKLNTAIASPNPSTGSFRINMPSLKTGTVEMQLFDSDGRLILRKLSPAKNLINVEGSDLKAGTYILKLKQGELSESIKLIKQ